MTLSPDEVRSFHDRGWAFVPSAIGPEELGPVIAELDAFVALHAERLRSEGVLDDDFAGEGFETRLARICERTEVVHRMLFNRGYLRPALFDLLRSERILDLVEPLVGPEIACHSGYRIRPKIPAGLPLVPRVRAVGAMPWHQDAAYLDASCDDGLYVTVWTPLTEVTPENGCVEIIGGVRAVVPHRNVRGRPFLEIANEHLPDGPRYLVHARPGDLLLMSSLVPHRSGENLTARIRWSMDLRYHRPDLPQGYAGEAGFLARSRAHPDREIRALADYERLRALNAPEEGPRFRRWPTVEPEPIDPRTA